MPNPSKPRKPPARCCRGISLQPSLPGIETIVAAQSERALEPTARSQTAELAPAAWARLSAKPRRDWPICGARITEGQHSSEKTRRILSAARASCASLSQILEERAYTADAVQKLFSASHGTGSSQGFRAAGLLADYTEVAEKYEGAVEQFLREELEYVVVETFDSARAGISLLREEMGGRATFFVDSLRSLNLAPREIRKADSRKPRA